MGFQNVHLPVKDSNMLGNVCQGQAGMEKRLGIKKALVMINQCLFDVIYYVKYPSCCPRPEGAGAMLVALCGAKTVF